MAFELTFEGEWFVKHFGTDVLENWRAQKKKASKEVTDLKELRKPLFKHVPADGVLVLCVNEFFDLHRVELHNDNPKSPCYLTLGDMTGQDVLELLPEQADLMTGKRFAMFMLVTLSGQSVWNFVVQYARDDEAAPVKKGRRKRVAESGVATRKSLRLRGLPAPQY